MPNSKDVFHWVVSQIPLDEPVEEIKSIACLLLEHELKLTRAQIMAGQHLASFDQDRLSQLITRINNHEPIQYILGEQHFYGRAFKVDGRVLIPRPETELLVTCALSYAKGLNGKVNLLDVGTGSGCLAVTLSLEISHATVTGIDISDSALAVATANNHFHKASANFLRCDILNEPMPVGNYDIIVSNPPYVTAGEKTNMKKNVLGYEPHLALFVTDAHPLQFYEAILTNAARQLHKGGMLAVEINERYGNEVLALFEKTAFQKVEIIKDLFGKERVVKGILQP